MIYIKLEENLYNFIDNKYENVPDFLKKAIYKLRYKNKKIINKKVKNGEYIILPSVNKKILGELKKLKDIRCWKNICISSNLMENAEFMEFANDNLLNIMDGKWLLKNIVDKIIEYIADSRKESLNTYEISILCNELDDTIVEKIKEICQKVKICNIFTNNQKQYKKLEEEMYKEKNIILNVSNNCKKMLDKSIIIINFDFDDKQIQKCIFSSDACIINVNKKLDNSEFGERNIISYKMNLPEKYSEYQNIFENFDSNALYESFIYKNTSYKNIKKELSQDDAKIVYLKDVNDKIIKKSKDNLSKKLDKITI